MRVVGSLLTLFLLWPCAGMPGTHSVASAQEAKATTHTPPEGDAPVSVEEVKPGGLYLRNESGELVYVPDVSYEQFERLLRAERNLAQPQRPAFVMKAMDIMARAVEGRVELDVEFTLEGRAADAAEGGGGWVRVPLRFDRAYLRAEPECLGPGNSFVTYEGEKDGYVGWLQASAGETHQISLPLSAALDRVGNESRLTFTAPTPLASTLTLRVPGSPSEGTVRDGADDTSRPLAFEVTPEGEGQFFARGIRGNVTLAWHTADAAGERPDVRLDVSGTVRVTADEVLQEVRSEGQFVVRGLGGTIDRFQVRLPPGMRLRDSSGTGYQVRPAAVEDETGGMGQLVEVRLDRPTLGDATVHLSAELPPDPDDPAWPLTVSRLVDKSEEFEPARFEFLGAVRHRGSIDFVINGDWALQWVEDVDFPRVDTDSPPPGTAAVSARFRYHNQRGSLKVSIRQKATRIGVEPKYDLYVDARHVRLVAEFQCETRGSRAGPLAIRMPGWTVEIVQFAEGTGALPIDLAETNPLVVPIPVEAQAAGRFGLRLEARQDLTAGVISGTGPLRSVMPLVEAANPSRVNLVLSPATVAVHPAQNILLTPLPQQIQALAPLVTAPATGSGVAEPGSVASAGGAGGEQPVLRYRDRGASEQGVFVADFRIQPQSISVTASGTATIDRHLWDLEQRLAYSVLHEPVETLMLSVPAALVSPRGIDARILFEDQPLVPVIQDNGENDRVKVLVRLPRPLLGPMELRINHTRRSLPELTPEQGATVSLPLILPAARVSHHATMIGNSLTVSHHRALLVEPADRRWSAQESGSGVGKLVFVASADTREMELRVAPRGAEFSNATVAYQAWVQTWLVQDQRRDRAVFRVRTSEPRVRIVLPREEAHTAKGVRVAIDQREVPFEGPDPQGIVTCPVPAAAPASAMTPVPVLEPVSEHVVEIWYTITQPSRSTGRRVWTAPGIDAVDQVERSYWQLVLPRGEVLLAGDRAWMMEWHWQWVGYGWRRGLLREQADLEQWVGASTQALIPASTNQYVFTTFGLPRKLAVTGSSRALLLLAASGSVLVAGLLVIYFPVLRHPAALLVLSGALLTLGLFFPEPATLTAQFAVMGLCLVLLGRVFHTRLWRRGAGEGAGRHPISDSKILEIRYPRADGSSRVGAASVPLTAQSSVADSN